MPNCPKCGRMFCKLDCSTSVRTKPQTITSADQIADLPWAGNYRDDEHLIERVARAIWEDHRSRIKNPDGLNARLTWRSIQVPEQFWESYINDALAALKAI